MREDETAGALEPFEDAALYDWEYRRRRDDVRFYRMLADERGGPILDLGCGTGRLMVPLLRDGHIVVGVDHAPAMLRRAAQRLGRLRGATRRRALLVRGDLRQLAVKPRFAFAIVAFHGIQHLTTDRDLLLFLRRVRATLIPGGWLAFDVFAPRADLLDRARVGDPARRWDRTQFHHPASGQRLVYTASHRLDPRRRTLLTTFHYQPVDQRGRPSGVERHARLCHRQLDPAVVAEFLTRAGLQLLQRWQDFEGSPLQDRLAGPGDSNNPDSSRGATSEQHVYLARRI
jgi:SAM-dependent methyltransferase